MRIALATAAFLPNGSDDDQVLMGALRAHGIEPVPVIWDQPAAWSGFDTVVLRSIWDYHLKYARFLSWLDELDAARVPIHNHTSVVRWNADKRYLLELESRDVQITPTRLIERGSSAALAALKAQTGWARMVVKPTVASTGYETWVTNDTIDAASEERFRSQASGMDLLVQEFIPGVYQGEISLVFLHGAYSHAVLKRAAGAEFRVHIEHGGTVHSYQPEPHLISWAESVVDTVRAPWTYARVDLVSGRHGPMLMELEMLDPELFFKYDPPAAERLIAALRQQLHAR